MRIQDTTKYYQHFYQRTPEIIYVIAYVNPLKKYTTILWKCLPLYENR